MIGSVLYQIKYFGLNSPTIRSVKDLRSHKLEAVVFWGGSDINPGIYGHVNVASQEQDLARDILECALIEECITRKIPMIGVCRGAQLLCAMFGGTLYQHVSGHGHGNHPIVLTRDICKEYAEGTAVSVSTSHHQMMKPSDRMEIIAVSREPLSNVYVTAEGEEKDKRPEVEVAFIEQDRVRALMMQYHPEYGSTATPMGQLTKALVDRFIL